MLSVSCSTWIIILCLIHYCLSQTTSPPTNKPTSKPTFSPTLPYTNTSQCSVSFDTVSASFNLCPLRIGEGGGQIKYYKVEDNRFVNTTTTSTSYTYNYYFNVAAALQQVGIPSICKNTSYTHQYCPVNTDCSGDNNTIPIINASWAYQVRVNSVNVMDACWALSNENGGPPEWRLIDELDPSLGVQLIYKNGDYTDDYECKSNRKFNIKFECEDNVMLFIPDEIPLYEYEACEYTLSVPSQYGCPIECKMYDNQICSSHGLCAFDNTNNASRCFCFNAYIGDDCSVYDTTSSIPDDAAKPEPSGNYAFTFKNALDTGVDVIYDLSPFGADNSHAGKNGGVYIVHDKDFHNNPDRSWTYYVAITTQLNPASTDSILPNYCQSIQAPCINSTQYECIEFANGVNETQWTGQGLVFQVNNNTEHPECYVLGRALSSPDLYDKIDDPARGVTITYNEGSWCDEAKKNREFRVNLVCPRDQTAIFDKYEETEVDILYEYVEEEETCIYALTIESAIACPYQCITNTTDINADNEDKEAFTVCSRQGICAADPEAGFVRCLCDYGWKGVYCSEIDSPNPTLSPTKPPTISQEIPQSKTGFVAVIVILIIIILVVVGVGYFIYKNQKMRISQQEDEIAFHKMTDKGMVGKDAVTTNVITDENTGKRGFATIDTTAQQHDDEDDNDASD